MFVKIFTKAFLCYFSKCDHDNDNDDDQQQQQILNWAPKKP